MKLLLTSFIALFSMTVSYPSTAETAQKAITSPVIDGNANDMAWTNLTWHALNQPIIGPLPEENDFSGRYKVTWDENHLYILAEIIDDHLYDAHPDPKQNYWDDDCLEIFIDADASGGDHLYNFNAFAYHVALDGQVADLGPLNADGTSNVVLLPDHVTSRWKRSPDAPYEIIWEVAVKVFDDTYSVEKHAKGESKPTALYSGKALGFLLAYCDNDGSPERESFIGSHAILPVNGDKNLGYKDASVFSKLTLIE